MESKSTRFTNALAALRARRHGLARTRLRRGVRLTVERGGVVDVQGRLDLGTVWRRGRPYPAQLIVRPGGTFRVRGSWEFSTGFKVWVDSGAVLDVGSGGTNYGAEIFCSGSITIGEDVGIGYGATLRDSDDHAVTGGSGPGAIVIGDHVLIASRAMILPGVTIGDGAVVAAGAVVTRDVPSRAMVAGVPARVVREDVDWR
jgi:acetyltransferase-like isoleucine patch superfamily enzyme